MKYKLFIENNDDNKFTPRSWSDVASSSLKPKLDDIPVNSSSVSHSGVGVLDFPTAESRDQAADVLGTDYKVTKKSEPSKRLAPKIKIIGVPSDLFRESDDGIIDQIRSKNTEICELINEDEDFKIIHKDTDDGSIIIKTTGRVREAINLMRNKIYIGLQRLNVYDHIHVIQCYRCQGYGHYASSDICKSKNGACFYCADTSHKSTNCPKKQKSADHRCVNCIREKRPNFHHKATDVLCPVRVRETLRIYNRTDGISSEAKNYYTKKIESLKHRRRNN